MHGSRFGYALANGTVGVYDRTARYWRIKVFYCIALRTSLLKTHILKFKEDVLVFKFDYPLLFSVQKSCDEYPCLWPECRWCCRAHNWLVKWKGEAVFEHIYLTLFAIPMSSFLFHYLDWCSQWPHWWGNFQGQLLLISGWSDGGRLPHGWKDSAYLHISGRRRWSRRS